MTAHEEVAVSAKIRYWPCHPCTHLGSWPDQKQLAQVSSSMEKGSVYRIVRDGLSPSVKAHSLLSKNNLILNSSLQFSPCFCEHLLSARCPAILSREWKSTRLFLIVSCDSQMTFQIQGRMFRPSCPSCPSMATMPLMRRPPTPTVGQMGSPSRAYSLQILLDHIPHTTMTGLPSPNIPTAHCSEMSSGR